MTSQINSVKAKVILGAFTGPILTKSKENHFDWQHRLGNLDDEVPSAAQLWSLIASTGFAL